ncbi:MAG: ferritin family protein [Magnetospirillum sp.]|nr:ferritin family protein [Magnetospirillum sp.]
MPPPINPLYPLRRIGSIDELMGLAIAMEREAADRYGQLAQAMRAQGEGDLAELFLRLAELERDHQNGLGRWADREGRVPSEPEISWRLPETFGDEGGLASLTPYRALGLAVANEERAFAFYTYLAALAEHPDIQRRAEALAREELNHLQTLRRMRRRAFHAQRGAQGGEREGLPRPRDSAHFAALVHGLETASAQVDEEASHRLHAEGDAEAAAVLMQVAMADRRRAGPQVDAASAPASPSVEAARRAGLLEPAALSTAGALQLSLRNAEEVAEFYLAVAERPLDEAMLGRAQHLAEEAVARLAVVRTLMTQREGKRP